MDKIIDTIEIIPPGNAPTLGGPYPWLDPKVDRV